MLSDFDQYFQYQTEPTKSCLLALKDIILSIDSKITTAWKYRMPFFCVEGKMFCYLWKDKITHEPYIGIVNGNKLDHPLLEKGDRSRMKILRINPFGDLPVETIRTILVQAFNYQTERKL